MSQFVVEQLLVPFAFRVFLVFGLVGVVVGLGLMVDPGRMGRLFGLMNRWFSARHASRWLAIPRDSGPVVERFRRILGVVIVLGAGFSTFILTAHFDLRQVTAALAGDVPQSAGGWLIDSLRWLLVVGGLAALGVGIMLLFFPAAWRAVERRVDRWVSSRSLGRAGETMHLGFDFWVERHPRAVGGTITAGALVVAVVYGMLAAAA